MNNQVGAAMGGQLFSSQPKDFGLRVTPVDGGYFINNFAGGNAVRVTLEDAKAFVNQVFDETFAPTPDAPQTETQINEVGVETAEPAADTATPETPTA